jgi:hypothetical protein
MTKLLFLLFTLFLASAFFYSANVLSKNLAVDGVHGKKHRTFLQTRCASILSFA